MRSHIYHAPLGAGTNRAWVTLEKLTDDGDIGTGHIVKAILAILAIAACFAAVLCMIQPF